jgi:hypothetical protein
MHRQDSSAAIKPFQVGRSRHSHSSSSSSSSEEDAITFTCPGTPVHLTCLILADNLIIHRNNAGRIISSEVVNHPPGQLDIALGSIDEILACVRTSCRKTCTTQDAIADRICSITYTDSKVTIRDDIYRVVRTFEVTDACGNRAFFRQIVTFTADNESSPVLTIRPTIDELLQAPYNYQPCDEDFSTLPPSDITGGVCECIFIGCSPSDLAIDTALGAATVSPGGILEPVVTTGIIDIPNCYKYQLRVFEAVDKCGNQPTSICRIVSWIVDNTPPNVDVPPTLTIKCTDPVIFTPPGASDNCFNRVTYGPADANYLPTVDQKIQNPDGSTTYIRTWTYYGACGAQTVRTQTIIQLPCGPNCDTCGGGVTPSVTCGADYDFDIRYCQLTPTDADFQDVVISTDTAGFCSDATVTYTKDSGIYYPPDRATLYTRTATVTDSCGHTSDCVQFITVPDCMTIDCSATKIVPCGTIVTVDDFVGINIVVHHGVGIPQVVPLEGVSSAPGPNNSTIYSLDVQVTDDIGQTAICTQHITSPACQTASIDCGPLITLSCGLQVPSPDQVLRAATKQFTFTGFSGQVTTTATLGGSSISNLGGTDYTFQIHAVGQSGGDATCSLIVNVPPTCPIGTGVINCPPSQVSRPCNLGPPTINDFYRLTANDISGFCDSFDNLNITYNGPFEDIPGSKYSVIATVSDSCGNAASCKQTITLDCPPPTGLFACNELFWTTHPELWDSFNDPTVAAMPFDPRGLGLDLRFVTSTNVWAYFNTAVYPGLSPHLTMYDALHDSITNGSACVGLLNQGVAALLNAAAFPNTYQYPLGATDFSSLFFLLKSALDQANEMNCQTLVDELSISNTQDQSHCANLVSGDLSTIVIVPNPDTTIGCTETPTFVDPTATTLCGGFLIPTPVKQVDNIRVPAAGVNPDGSYSLTRVWQATDACGGIVYTSQTITVPKCPPALRVKRTFVPANAK